MAECILALRHKTPVTDLCRRPAGLRFDFGFGLLLSLRGKLLCHGLLEFFNIHSVAFGSIHENVTTTCGGSLISGIQQADLQKQLAEFGLVISADLFSQKLLRRRRFLLRLYLMPLRQSRDLAVGEMTDQVFGDRQQVGLLERSRYTLENRSQYTMASRDGQFLLFDALPLLCP